MVPGPTLSPPAPAPSAAPRPILDPAFLAGLAEDIGFDSVLEALGLFREDAPMRITVIRGCLARDPGLLRREAHALAGASRNIGLVRLGEAASALQYANETAEPGPVQVESLAALVGVSLLALDEWERETVALI
jgi:HPt (histidine-containing phosphotransfer) domain-containing protein